MFSFTDLSYFAFSLAVDSIKPMLPNVAINAAPACTPANSLTTDDLKIIVPMVISCWLLAFTARIFYDLVTDKLHR